MNEVTTEKWIDRVAAQLCGCSLYELCETDVLLAREDGQNILLMILKMIRTPTELMESANGSWDSMLERAIYEVERPQWDDAPVRRLG